MKYVSTQVALLLLLLAFAIVAIERVDAAEWSVPVAGNAFRTEPAAARNGIRRDGIGRGGTLAWRDRKTVFSVYFHLDRPAVLQLAVEARSPAGRATLEARVDQKSFTTSIDGPEYASHSLGRVEVAKSGYVRVDLKGKRPAGETFGEVRQLVVASETQGLTVDYVASNEGGMFYWGRRGPSVHLNYQVPKDRVLRYAYSEVTVPVGQDPIGSFYMANGFGEGYFGMQVNSEKERRVLFSVWSPFKTDNPRDIPADQRIIALGKGPGVRVGEFGNEGSGGQSFLVYPWQAGKTYSFLTEVVPDGEGNTNYTSWFGDAAEDQWRLVAGFRRPQTDTNLRRFHSFLESFSPTFGYLGRRAFYGNVWVGDVEGNWHECLQARFSVDATGRKRQRLDFTGGTQGERFFLRNCGFFHETGRPGDVFTRKSSTNHPPNIDIDKLPRG